MDFLEKILLKKVSEVEAMPIEEVQPLRQVTSFCEQVNSYPKQMHLIGEIKRASPSKGTINLAVNGVKQAKLYEAAGVSAISVLTDEHFFNGSIETLREVAAAVRIPVLCKDFIIDEKQLIRARNAGATMVLLIVAALSKRHLASLYKRANELGLEVLLEVHDQKEQEVAERLGAPLIGVNNRNLKTFEVSIETSVKLGKSQKSPAVYISESGFETAEQVRRVSDKYQGILVGAALMRSSSPIEKVKELQVRR
jgi:indole-3-glycerol phosphate synthase